MTDEPDTPAVLNVWAAVGLAVSFIVGVSGLFVLPWLRSQGLSFTVAFVGVLFVELVAVLGVTFFALNLYDEVF